LTIKPSQFTSGVVCDSFSDYLRFFAWPEVKSRAVKQSWLRRSISRLHRQSVRRRAPVLRASPNEVSTSAEQPCPIGDDEITVDGHVMKPDVRGTSHDPRALQDEQWLVKVRMIDDGRTFNVQADEGQFDKLKAGDRVRVRYRIGKYTKTVWGAEIEETNK
jgi:hypothetical protein